MPARRLLESFFTRTLRGDALGVLPFALAYVYGIAVVLGLLFRGPAVWLPVVLTFIIMPILDAYGGVSLWNPEPADEDRLAHDRRYRFIIFAWVPFEIAAIACATWLVAQPATTWPDRAGLALGVGLMNGVVGITYAHELIHRPNRFERLLGEILLALATYSHFRIEHVWGHHRTVATSEDPATSRVGETFYAFFARSVRGQVLSAFRIEESRLRRAGLRVLGPGNRMLRYVAVNALSYAVVARFAGWVGVAFFALQSIVAFASLEIVNYIEHYGLVRRRLADGKYESVGPEHSWNAGYRMSNWLLVNLARHSDHHAAASRRYQILRTYDDTQAPKLPFGYATMYLLALAPPLWFRIMNARLARWQAAQTKPPGAAPGRVASSNLDTSAPSNAR